jgi:hypothetical protein
MKNKTSESGNLNHRERLENSFGRVENQRHLREDDFFKKKDELIIKRLHADRCRMASDESERLSCLTV